MTGPDHYRKAEQLAAKANEYLGQGEGQDSAAVWAAVAQIHATLALAAASALGTTAAEGRGWADVAGTKFLAGSPQTLHLRSSCVRLATDETVQAIHCVGVDPCNRSPVLDAR